MKSPSHLLTAGCSYSQPNTIDEPWPLHLDETLSSVEYILHTGHGAAGNQTISRKVISGVLDALEQGISPDQMLVGIMWSGSDRQEHYSENYEKNYSLSTKLGGNDTYTKFLNSIENNGFVTPTFIHKSDNDYENKAHHNMQNPYALRNSKIPTHYILNPHWKDELTMKYFEDFMNPEKAIIETCEHILRTQWFLKDKGIRYFMTEYDHDVFSYMGHKGSTQDRSNNKNETLNLETKSYSRHTESVIYPNEYTQEKHFSYLNNPEINYLYNEIDKKYWLPINNLQDWVTNVSEFKHRDINPDTGLVIDPHPSTEQHKDFVNQIILPFLLEKYNI